MSLNKTATVSSSSASGYTGSQAVDNSPRTYWCAGNGTFPQWLSVDLGVITPLSLIQTKFYANEQWKYKIEGSLDNVIWSSLASHTDGAEGYLMKDSVNELQVYSLNGHRINSRLGGNKGVLGIQLVSYRTN